MRARWREESARAGRLAAWALVMREFAGFLRDSTPQRRRSRYGDMEYDWEYRVNTTSGSVNWRDRLLGVFHSPYQPTDAAVFREMIEKLPIDPAQFTFVDLGSGKGRTLLLAAEFPFREIVGIEIVPALHRVAVQNIALADPATPARLQSVCMDATEYSLPETPLVVYLFNPLPEAGLGRVVGNLEGAVRRAPREVWVVYHNPLLEHVLESSAGFERVLREPQYAIFRARQIL